MIYMVNIKSQRFYWMAAKQDLFNTWCVHKIYGGISNNHHRSVLVPCLDKNEAYTLLTKFEQIRLKHGYTYSGLNNPEYFALKPQTIDEVLSAGKING